MLPGAEPTRMRPREKWPKQRPRTEKAAARNGGNGGLEMRARQVVRLSFVSLEHADVCSGEEMAKIFEPIWTQTSRCDTLRTARECWDSSISGRWLIPMWTNRWRLLAGRGGLHSNHVRVSPGLGLPKRLRASAIDPCCASLCCVGCSCGRFRVDGGGAFGALGHERTLLRALGSG